MTKNEENETKQQFHKKYLKSKKFAAVRDYVLSRDGHRCAVCGRTEKLVCHHRCYKHLGEANLNEINDCVTLCQICHLAHHKQKPNLNWYNTEHPRNRNDLKIITLDNDIQILANEQLTEIYEPDTFHKIPIKHLKRNGGQPSIVVNGIEIKLGAYHHQPPEN